MTTSVTHRLRRSVRMDRLTVEYDDRVLEPRPWTAMQARWGAELVADGPDGPLLELCCGAGHIGLLAALASGRSLVAVDVDAAAAYFTRLNAEGAGIEHRVEMRLGLLEEALEPGERFALALADPPWVSSARVDDYPDDPRRAIDGGADGLVLARACVSAVSGHLAPRGSLLLQLGDDEQGDTLLREAARDGWHDGGRRSGDRGVVVRLLHP